MKIKCMSFSKIDANLKSYVFEKLDLFEFLFTQIILKDNLDTNTKFVECLKSLDIAPDLFYLFNNVFYKFKDNHIIECLHEDIYEVCLKDIKVNPLFVESLSKGNFPVYKGNINKEFVYDYLNKKITTYKESYSDSNIVCFETSDKEEVQSIVNRFANALFNDNSGIYLLENLISDPYYFEIELNKEDGKYVYKRSNKEELYNSLVNNSLMLENKEMDGEYLSNNIYFDVLFGKENMKDNSKYVFVFDELKHGEVNNNIIYVNYKFDDCCFVDLVNKEKYRCGVSLLENNSYISTFTKSREDKVSEFKLYLIKHKDKFKINLNEILEMI